MKTDIGEYIVGAYLKLIKGCDVIDYNVRLPAGGIDGLNELDVIGLDFKSKTAYVCEVTTHIRGLLYKDNKTTIERIRKKHAWQKKYSNRYLSDFHTKHYMFWSPIVPEGYLTDGLGAIQGLEVIINKAYANCITELRLRAQSLTNDIGNPFFRMLQILGCVEKRNSEKCRNKTSIPSSPKGAKKGCIAMLRDLYVTPGAAFSKEELLYRTGAKLSTLSTALSDIKNPKYAGKQGPLIIEKCDDGKYRCVIQ